MNARARAARAAGGVRRRDSTRHVAGPCTCAAARAARAARARAAAARAGGCTRAGSAAAACAGGAAGSDRAAAACGTAATCTARMAVVAAAVLPAEHATTWSSSARRAPVPGRGTDRHGAPTWSAAAAAHRRGDGRRARTGVRLGRADPTISAAALEHHLSAVPGSGRPAGGNHLGQRRGFRLMVAATVVPGR